MPTAHFATLAFPLYASRTIPSFSKRGGCYGGQGCESRRRGGGRGEDNLPPAVVEPCRNFNLRAKFLRDDDPEAEVQILSLGDFQLLCFHSCFFPGLEIDEESRVFYDWSYLSLEIAAICIGKKRMSNWSVFWTTVYFHLDQLKRHINSHHTIIFSCILYIYIYTRFESVIER